MHVCCVFAVPCFFKIHVIRFPALRIILYFWKTTREMAKVRCRKLINGILHYGTVKVIVIGGRRCLQLRGGGHWHTLPFPSLPFPLLPPFPFPLPLPLEVASSGLRLGRLGERCSSPGRSGRSPAAKRYLMNFRLKISLLVATIFGSFPGNETSNWGLPSGIVCACKM